MSVDLAVFRPASSVKTKDKVLAGSWPIWWADAVAIMSLVVIIGLVSWHLAAGMIVGQDASTFFYPMFAFLGRSLRAGHLPGWNPFQFSGMPFAGDPESGWFYLPAMVFFTAFSVAIAVKVYALFHFVWAGLAAYTLARYLGFDPVGALSVGLFFSLSTFNYEHAACCPMYGQVDAWVPTLLLGTIVAMRAKSWFGRVAGWGLGGLALSQLLAAWLGQGTYYVFLVWGAFVLYLLISRWLVEGWSTRMLMPIGHAVMIGALGMLLGLGGLLPRFEANAASNIPGGNYQDTLGANVVSGGWQKADVIREMFNAHSGSYPGMVIVVLAALALVLVGWRLAVPYFLLVTGGALLLALQTVTPLQRVLFLLPDFQKLSQHQQQRVLVFGYMGLAFLAGAAVNEMWRRRPTGIAPLHSVEMAVIVPLLIFLLRESHPVVALWSVTLAALAASLVILVIATRKRWLVVGRALVLVLLLLGLTDNMHISHALTVSRGSFYTVDASEYFAPSGAAAFLKAQGSNGWRYLGYDPQLMKQGYTTYRFFFADPRQFGIDRVDLLLVNNRGTLFGVPDIQGYDPLQLLRYADFINAVNGRRQEYHETNVLPSGLASPLLDVLGVRYVLLPARVDWSNPQLKALVGLPVVYRDADVQIVERTTAFPRSWIVHQTAWGSRAAVESALGEKQFVLRRTALTEEKVAGLQSSPDLAAESVQLLQQGPQQVRLQVKTLATGMVVLSDPYYSAWHAYVDGKPTKVYVVDGALRGVVVPTGTHTLEFRYEDSGLEWGVRISSVTAFLLVLALIVLGWRDHRSRKRER